MIVSTTHGNMDDAQVPRRQLSMSDFDAFRRDLQIEMQEQRREIREQQREIREQQKEMEERQNSMQECIDNLDRHPRGSERVTATSSSQEEGNEGLIGQDKDSDGGVSSQKEEVVPLTESAIESMIEARYDKYKLPESTYTLLMTQEVFSVPFGTGIISWVLSMLCLVLAFMNELDNGEPGSNTFAIPAGVQTEVHVAQYLGVIVGVLMEEEIPQGLELIGKGAEQKISRRASQITLGAGISTQSFSTARVVLPALLRLAVGYMFIICLFLVVVQESSVLDIFFDVLALEFVQRIDDVIFALSKRGFFGHQLRDATTKSHCIDTTRESHTCRSWTKRVIRFVYIFNALLGIGLLTTVTIKQRKGHYRCESVYVDFGDALLEEAFVTLEDVQETRFLLYSHFNGIYVENGTHDGRPKYTERNKVDGHPFIHTVGAEIVYCEAIDSWLFRHEHIKTSHGNKQENDCSWLLSSAETNSFDLIELADESEWLVMTSHGVQADYKVSIECTECDDDFDCNYNGQCVSETGIRHCQCDNGYFGIACEFQPPCEVIRPEMDNATTLKLVKDPEEPLLEVYGRPMYAIHNMTGKPYSFLRLTYPDDDDHYFNVNYPDSTSAKYVEEAEVAPHMHLDPEFLINDDFFEVNNKNTKFQKLLTNYTFVLQYTGQRWLGQINSPDFTAESVQKEYHAFWRKSLSNGQANNSTVIVSAPTTGGSPVGVDFFEMRRRNVADGDQPFQYDPYGLLLPLVEYEGSGFFHCNLDLSDITNGRG